MAVFKNTKFVERDYERSNIVAAVASAPPTISYSGYVYGPGDWSVGEEADLAGLLWLCTIGLGDQAVKFYGYL